MPTKPLTPPLPVPLLTTDEVGLALPGVGVLVDPERASEMGAFREDALSLDDVLAAQDEE